MNMYSQPLLISKKSQLEERNNGTSASQFSPNEKKALSFVDAFSRLRELNDEELGILQLAKKAIIEHRFQKLQRDINKLRSTTEKVKMKPVLVAEKLIEILKSYPLENGKSDSEGQPEKPSSLEDPEIIISESFH